jgi:hypothetical protein
VARIQRKKAYCHAKIPESPKTPQVGEFGIKTISPLTNTSPSME